jgi:hypothetical protein
VLVGKPTTGEGNLNRTARQSWPVPVLRVVPGTLRGTKEATGSTKNQPVHVCRRGETPLLAGIPGRGKLRSEEDSPGGEPSCDGEMTTDDGGVPIV